MALKQRPKRGLAIADNPRINWGHPAARGLRYLLLCGGYGAHEIVENRVYGALGGTAGRGALGEGWQSGGSGTRIVGPGNVDLSGVGDYTVRPVTVIVAGRFSTAGTPAATVISCSPEVETNSVGGWILKSEGYNDTSQVGATNPLVEDYDSGLATPLNDGAIISLRMTNGTHAFRAERAKSSVSNSAPTNVGTRIQIGAYVRELSSNFDPLYSGDVVYWAAIFNRSLTDLELELWHTSPVGEVLDYGSKTYHLISAAAAGLLATVLNQEGFRFRADDGDEDGASWLEAQDTALSIEANSNTRLRVLVNNGGLSGARNFELEYRKQGDALFKKVKLENDL